MMAIFVKIFENHISGEFVKIREFTLVIILVIFSSKMTIQPKKESLEVSRNSAYHFVISVFTRKKCSGSVSYDSQFLSYGSENHFVTFDLTDTRPIVIEKNSSPVYFTKFKSVSNQQICIDLDRNIFVYE